MDKIFTNNFDKITTHHQDFIKRLIAPAEERFSAEQALEHPFLNDNLNAPLMELINETQLRKEIVKNSLETMSDFKKSKDS